METLEKSAEEAVEAGSASAAKSQKSKAAGRAGKQAPGLTEVMGQPADHLFALNEAGIQTCFQINEAILKGTSALNQELMSFADKRLRHDMEASQTIMGRGIDVAKAMKLQQDFSRSMTQDYFACASRLVELAGEMGKGVSVPLGKFYHSTMGTLDRRSY